MFVLRCVCVFHLNIPLNFAGDLGRVSPLQIDLNEVVRMVGGGWVFVQWVCVQQVTENCSTNNNNDNTNTTGIIVLPLVQYEYHLYNKNTSGIIQIPVVTQYYQWYPGVTLVLLPLLLLLLF